MMDHSANWRQMRWVERVSLTELITPDPVFFVFVFFCCFCFLLPLYRCADDYGLLGTSLHGGHEEPLHRRAAWKRLKVTLG